jgi:hypothetical protein
MHKIFLAVSSMIFTGFLMKSWKKLHEKPETKEEVYRRMKAEYDRRRAEARPTIAKLDSISTPRDGAKMMAAIGSVQQMRDALRPCRPVDGCDVMAMAPGRFA